MKERERERRKLKATVKKFPVRNSHLSWLDGSSTTVLYISFSLSLLLLLNLVLYSPFEPFSGSLFLPISFVGVLFSSLLLLAFDLYRRFSLSSRTNFGSVCKNPVFKSNIFVLRLCSLVLIHTVWFQRVHIFFVPIKIVVVSDSKLKSSIYYHTLAHPTSQSVCCNVCECAFLLIQLTAHTHTHSVIHQLTQPLSYTVWGRSESKYSWFFISLFSRSLSHFVCTGFSVLVVFVVESHSFSLLDTEKCIANDHTLWYIYGQTLVDTVFYSIDHKMVSILSRSFIWWHRITSNLLIHGRWRKYCRYR